MNYTIDQISQIVARVINELEKDNISTLSLEQRINVAENPNIPPEILDRLADDRDWGVRTAVADNPNTPPETLARLVYDKVWDVRYEVAKNPNTLPETLARLADDKNQDVCSMARQHPKYVYPISQLKEAIQKLQKLIDASQNESLKNIRL